MGRLSIQTTSTSSIHREKTLDGLARYMYDLVLTYIQDTTFKIYVY